MALDIGGMFASGASAFMSGLAKQGGQRLAGSAIDKVMGIPTPTPKTGAALGADMRAYQDQAFPGTNPWERLGGSGYPGGGVETAKQAGKVQKEMQTKELATRVQVANIGAQAHVQSAATQLGSQAVRASKAIQEGYRVPDFKTPAQAQIGKIKQETLTEVARTAVEGSRAQLEAALAKLAKPMAEAKLTAEQTRNTTATIVNAMKEIEKGEGKLAGSVGLHAVGGTALGIVASRIPIVKAFMAKFGAKHITRKPILGKLKSGRPQMNPQKRPQKAPKRPPLGSLSKKAIKGLR